MAYNMKCLICSYTDANLIRIQEHVMDTHHYSQPNLQRQTRRELDPGHYIFTMPDGIDWLEAVRSGGNFVEGL